MQPKADMFLEECGFNESETASCLCARMAWRFPGSPAMARDGELIQTQYFCHHNKLTLNVKKTKNMLIGNKKLLNEADYVDVRLYMVMDSIEQVGVFKCLGVWLDSSLTFTSQISKMSSKISSAIGVISSVSRYLPVVQLKMLYNAMVRPYFNYCSITWSTADQKHLD